MTQNDRQMSEVHRGELIEKIREPAYDETVRFVVNGDVYEGTLNDSYCEFAGKGYQKGMKTFKTGKEGPEGRFAFHYESDEFGVTMEFVPAARQPVMSQEKIVVETLEVEVRST